MQIYNEKGIAKKGKIQNEQFEEERASSKYKHMKENPLVKWNKGSGDVRARTYSTKLPI